MGKKEEPYYGTEVPVERSKEKIREILMKNGAVTHQFTEATEQQVVEVKWARKIIIEEAGHTREVIQPCRIRVCHGGRKDRQIWRALFYHLKAKFEIVRFGIISYEEEFLPYFLTMLPNGQQVTVAEMALPYLDKGLSPDIKPLMLPEKTRTGDASESDL